MSDVSVADRTVLISVFKDSETTDSQTRNIKLTDFVSMLVGPPESVEGLDGLTKAEVKAIKNKAEMWSGATYPNHSRRKGSEPDAISCVALDFDKGLDGEDGLSEEDEDLLFDWLKQKEYLYAAHTSFSSGYVAPKKRWRVVLFFQSSAKPTDYELIWDKLNSELPIKPDHTRRQRKGCYFSPRCPAEHASFYASYTDGHKFLSPLPGPVFGDLNAVRVGWVDQYDRVRNAKNKEPELSGACYQLGKEAKRLGRNLEAVQKEILPKMEEALRANKNPVEDWNLARSTILDSLEEGYEAETEVQAEIAAKVTDFQPTERQIAKAEKALRDAVKMFHKDITKLYQRAFIVGRYVPHIIPLERAQQELWDAYMKPGTKTGEIDAEGQFLGGVQAQNEITTGLARGQKQPMFVASENWEKTLLRDEMGAQCCEENVKLLLQKHPAIEGLRWDVRRNVVTVESPPPWELNTTDFPAALGEDDAYAISSWCATQMGNRPLKNVKKVYSALKAAAKVHEYDPFLEYLEGLRWDLKPRLDTWLVDNAFAEDNAYTRLVSAKFVLQAVARTFEPGCKVDHVLVLIGTQQGEGKSTVFETLASREYFCADVGDIKEKESSLLLQKYVIVEMPELAGLNKKDSEEVKRYISNNSEEFRAAYRMDSEEIIRRAVFGGTTNVRECLRDETGGRRFWPVEVGELDIDRIKDDRDQLWAEAVHRYKVGEKWWPERGKETELCVAAQDQHLDKDDLAEDLEFFLQPVDAGKCAAKSVNPHPDQVDPETNLFRWVSVDQVYTFLGLDKKNRFDQTRVKSLGRLMKWQRTKIRMTDGSRRVFKW